MQRIQSIVDIAAYVARFAQGGVAFHEIAPARRSLPPAPIFLLGPVSATVNAEIFGQFEQSAIGCYAVKDAVVAPTGVAVHGDTAFTSPAFLHPHYHVSNMVGRLNTEEMPRRFVEGPLAVIYGPGHETYGHWLVDFMPRLWVLAQAGYDLAAIRYLVPPKLSGIARDLLRHAGIADAQMEHYAYWQELIETDLLLMPTGLRDGNRLSPEFRAANAFWIERLGEAAIGQDVWCEERVFLSRAHVSQERELANRATIEAIARRRGYALVQPEKLSLLEQVAMFGAARLVVGEYGSALHGSVYAQTGAAVCGLRGNSRHPSFVQSGIAGALGQSVGYVLGCTAGQDIAQNFTIEAADFERALDVLETGEREGGRA